MTLNSTVQAQEIMVGIVHLLYPMSHMFHPRLMAGVSRLFSSQDCLSACRELQMFLGWHRRIFWLYCPPIELRTRKCTVYCCARTIAARCQMSPLQLPLGCPPGGAAGCFLGRPGCCPPAW